jgi:hypothetical protein
VNYLSSIYIYKQEVWKETDFHVHIPIHCHRFDLYNVKLFGCHEILTEKRVSVTNEEPVMVLLAS